MTKRVGKRGDTLIEVMLAVGIFSMVAIAVAAVMSGGVSSAQTALEATLAREEIDTQAEALRFIHAAYIAEKNAGVENGQYTNLWRTITNEENVISGEGNIESVSKYDLTSCANLYNDNNNILTEQKAFILNTWALGSDDNSVYIPVTGNQNRFAQASTYPRLILSSTANTLVGGDSGELSKAEGIYIIAVKDPGFTTIAGSDGKKSAYFDFYIRTCWYGTGDQAPSTISTVIRLYDPEALPDIKPPSNPEPQTAENILKDSKYSISDDGNNRFAQINGRHYDRTNNNRDPVLLGFVCHASTDQGFTGRSFIGPVLVGPNSDSVKYIDEAGSPDDTGSITFDGKTYYYSSTEHWMDITTTDCGDSTLKDMIEYSKSGQKNIYQAGTTSAKNAVLRAAEWILQEAKKQS